MSKRLTVHDIVRDAGGAATMAATLGVSRQAVYGWMAVDRVPGNRARQICSVYHLAPALVLPLIAPPKQRKPYRKRRAEPRNAHQSRA